jgi:hypothetical protein
MHRNTLMSRWVLPHPVVCAIGLAFALIAPAGLSRVGAQTPSPAPGNGWSQAGGPQAAVFPKVKREPKKAKQAYNKGLREQQEGDWQAAHEAFAQASEWDPGQQEYVLRRESARSHLVQSKVDLAEKEAISGRLKEARKQLVDALYLDPTNRIVRDRLTELSAMAPDDPHNAPKEAELAGVVELDHQAGTRSFDFRGDTQGAYDEVARQFGVDVAFDVDLRSAPVRFKVDDVDFATAMRMLGSMTDTFWRALAKHLFIVTQDTPQKRRDYAASVVRTIVLPASESVEQMTETLRVVRDITGITRAALDTNARTMTLRASPEAVAVASGLIDDLQKPSGALILEIEVLEVDRSRALELGITPPQSSQIVSLNTQEIQEAQQSIQGLVDVVSSVFGTPSSLSGLSTSQITSLLGSGQLNAGSLLPPVVAFGGGESTFLATLPGAAANFSEMLSLVQNGRRILLRAQDAQPATFFVGDRVPVELSNYSASLSGTGTSVAGLSAANFPTTNYDVGRSPTFVATASLRNNGIDDLMVTNFTDNTVSVLLGNSTTTTSTTGGATTVGNGTFGTQTTFPTGAGPTSIATGAFQSDSNNQNVDLALTNQTANTVSILLGNGDGTFQPRRDIAAGNGPVSVIAENLHDLNGKGDLDLIVANFTDSTLYLYQGNGDGTFQNPNVIQLPKGYAPAAIAAADFNGDGHLDLAVADEGNATVSIFLGNGDGTFGPRTDYPTGNSPVWVSAADVNGDSVLDLEVANRTDNTVSVLLGNGITTTSTTTGITTVGNGTFGTQAIYPAGGEPTSIAVADYDINGLPDLAVTDLSDNAVSVLLNLGSGTFGPNFELPAGTGPASIVAANFDAENTNPDVAVANNGSNTVSVILNLSNFSTTSSAASSVFNSGAFPGVQYIDIGLKVKATPRIHLDGDVTLQLEFDISSLSGQSFNTIPVISNDTVSQTVRLKQNETAVLAAVLQRQLSNAINGAPGLATIPELGFFAGTQNPQNQDSELLFLVTPRMVRYAPRSDHVIYAGQGSLEGPANALPGLPLPLQPQPGQPPQPAGAPPPPAAAQPPSAPGEGEPAGLPQPTTQVGTPVGPPPQPASQPQAQPQPQPGQQAQPETQPQAPPTQQQQPPPPQQRQQ